MSNYLTPDTRNPIPDTQDKKMSFVYDALTKAEREGRLDSTWVPHVEEQPAISPPTVALPQEVVENFAMLKQNVQMAHAEQGVQVITITSSVPGEGCSTISYYLSLMLAQSVHSNNHVTNTDRDVYSTSNEQIEPRKSGILVIDGNLNKPNLHLLFGIDQQHGVNEFVLTASTKDKYTINISPNHFNFITSGKTNSNSQDIWVSMRIKSLMEKLRSQFEYILIDAPPVIGHPETLALSKLTDGVLFVVKANQTRWEIIDEARGQLQETGAKVLGVVLNERRFFIPGGIYRRI